MEASTECDHVLTMPIECLAHVLSFLPLRDLRSSSLTCAELRRVCSEPSIWQVLLSIVFGARAEDARGEFRARLNRYRAIASLHRQLLTHNSPFLSRPVEVNNTGVGVSMGVEVSYTGTSADSSESNTVGVVCANALGFWPVGDGAMVAYFEVILPHAPNSPASLPAVRS